MTNYFFSPVFNEQLSNANGVPLSGGLIFTYISETTTPATTYKTFIGVAHSNPIVLDSTGNIPDGSQLWLGGDKKYRFVLQDSNLNTLRTIENVIGINDLNDQFDKNGDVLWNGFLEKIYYISPEEFSVDGDQTLILNVYRRVKILLFSYYAYGTISESRYTTDLGGKTIVKISFDDGATPLTEDNIVAVSYSIIDPDASPQTPIFNTVDVINLASNVNDLASLVADLKNPNNSYVKSALNTSTEPPIYGIRAWATMTSAFASSAVTYTFSGGNIKSIVCEGKNSVGVITVRCDFSTPMPSVAYSVVGSASCMMNGSRDPANDSPAYICIYEQYTDYFIFCYGMAGPDDGRVTNVVNIPLLTNIQVICG